MNRTIITLILLSTTIIGKSQNYKKIDSLSAHLIEKYNLQGIGIVGVQNNKVIYQNSFGKTNQTINFSDSTKIYIASNTKAFVGLALSKLAIEKKIDYSYPISKYIPSSYFPEKIEVDKITVRNLMQHTHGLSNDPMIFRTAYSGEFPYDLRALLKFTVYRNDTLSYDFKYSNLGYLLGGIIIKEVTGQDWKEYVSDNIFKPIGMTETSAHIDFKQSLEALPFEHFSTEPISSRKSENTLHSAGGLYSTLGDMGKWIRIFTDENQTSINPKLLVDYLSDRTIVENRMGPFTMDEYGNGWIYGTLMGEKLFFHFGSFNGYESIMSFQPENKTGVFVFVNERVGGQRISAMLSAYFYSIMSNDSNADSKIQMFSQFIDPMYEKPKKERTLFSYENVDELTGTYYSPKYGNLMVDKNSGGYTFSLGRLKSFAYLDNENNGIIIEWTPGIEEHFTISKNQGKVKLIYDDFGEFIKK
ncbi:serine hydrolase domain-containing protein [Flagellimonas lutimaris]|uniref:serine hydrolase domain-containing protein n=1 Tax=Flagellimonas lutimaris TaxID=475082 RepID=UPI003F5CE743